MIRILPRLVLGLIIGLVLSASSVAQNKPARYANVVIGQETFGVITSDDSQLVEGLLGSGFVIDSNLIITCYHVFSEPAVKPKFFIDNLGTEFNIELYDSLPVFDIAIYKSDRKITYRPIKLGSYDNLNIGDSIFYLGYDVSKKSHVISLATIGKKYSILTKDSLIYCITFDGTAIPGYSGGPIFDSNGQVVAVIDQLVYIRNDDHPILLYNIGYSIKPLISHLNHLKE